jgi:hypothetical protein
LTVRAQRYLSFKHRAALYAQLDARLQRVTRFFGAACITNRVLGSVAAFSGRLTCSAETWRWLAETGALLEAANVSVARDLICERCPGPALDERIVSFEQAIFRIKTAGRTSRMLAELDAGLNFACPAWLTSLSDVRWYSHVLITVRAQLRTPIHFAEQVHREAIGMALIATLKRDGG